MPPQAGDSPPDHTLPFWQLGSRKFYAAYFWQKGDAKRQIITPFNLKGLKASKGGDEARRLLRVLATHQPANHRIGLMGIINATPDSFSDGGQSLAPEAAIANGKRLLAEGADILDIGGESTRPDAEEVSVAEELARVIQPITELVKAAAKMAEKPKIKISVDTQKAEVMKQAVAAGAKIINDVSALEGEGSAEVAAQSGAEVVLMHKQGTPKTMQQNPHYTNVVEEVFDYLATRIDRAVEAGIAKHKIMLDVGIGFGKTASHNGELLRAMPLFYTLGCPLVLGVSRKRFIGAMSKQAPPTERLGGSIAAVLAANLGAGDVVRCHDVSATSQALRVWEGLTAF